MTVRHTVILGKHECEYQSDIHPLLTGVKVDPTESATKRNFSLQTDSSQQNFLDVSD